MSASPELIDGPVREAIRTSLDTSLCVEAGAGTGKTTVLVERIVELLARGRGTVDEIAVITFTEKAAGELAARVRQRLESRRGETLDAAERERLDLALRDLHRAHVETIHAFAASLLRERPVEARLDPGFEVLDAVAAEVDFDRAYRAWLAETLEGEQPALELALRRGFDLRELRQAAEALHEHRYLVPLATPPPDDPGVSSFADWLSGADAELERLGSGCNDPDEDGAFAQIEPLGRFAKRCREAAEDRAELERLILFHAPGVSPGLGRAANWQASDCKVVKELLREYQRRLEAVRRELRTEALAGVLPLVEEFVAGYAAERRRDGRANFDDLLIWARDLLAEDREVRDYFRRRYTRVLVDEFQDTDPIQAELVAHLVSPEGVDADAWTDLRPSPGKLVVVGDPKQSIYRFRRADIAVYDAVKLGTLGGRERVIQQSFRSLPGILEWLNAVFDRILEAEVGVQPANVPLVPAADGLALERPSVVTVRRELPEGKAAEVRGCEAETLARIVRRAVADERWPVRHGNEVRTASWGDVAVLFPWRTGIELYEESLADAGVPFRHEGNRGFHSRQEVRDLISLLLAIDDPTDRVSLVAALRSGPFGCSDEDVFMYTAIGGALDYRRDPGGLDGAAPAAVVEALEVLGALHRERRGLSLAEMVRRVLERTHQVELALTLPGGEQAAANLLKVADQARAFSASQGGGLRAFAQWLAIKRDEESPESDAAVAEESDDVVRLLTIHAAKGLEFPIVALANIGSERSDQTKPVPDAVAQRLHLRVGTRVSGYFQTPGFDQAWDAEKHLVEAERRRWLYVATTRARDHLIVPIVTGAAKPGQMLRDLLPDLPAADAAPGSAVGGCHVYDPCLLSEAPGSRFAEAHPPDGHALDAAAAAREEWLAGRDAVVADAGRERRIVTATGLERGRERPMAAAIGAEDGSILLSPGGPALAIGDALHRVMELVDLPDGANLDRLARSICAEEGVDDHVGAVAAMARRCLASPAVRRAAASGYCHREVPFTLTAADGALVAGRVDLVHRDGAELVIVDYKTDSVGEAGLGRHLERHREQAALYAHAVARATGLPVREVIFVFARPGLERAFAADEGLLGLGEALAA